MAFYGKAVDFSFSRPTVGEMLAARVKGIVVYLRGAGKAIDYVTLWSYIHAGIAAAFVDELDIFAFRGGHSAGLDAGQRARAAMRALGVSDDTPIYVAFDTDITPYSADWYAAFQYMAGFNTGGGCGPQGAYGEMTMLNAMHASGFTRWEWESESRAFPGNAIDDPNAEIVQRFTHSLGFIPANEVDEDDIQATDWGQFPRPVTNPIPTPALPTRRLYRMVPLIDGKAHDGARLPYALLSPKDPTIVASVYTNGFADVPGKTSVVLGVQIFKLHTAADAITPAPSRNAIFVHFVDNTTGEITLAAGVSC